MATMRGSASSQRDQFARHDARVAGRLGACRDGLGHRRRGVTVAVRDGTRRRRSADAAGHDRHRRQGGAVEADLVGDGRLIAAALLGAHVDDDRAVHVAQRAAEHVPQPAQAVAGHRAGVDDAQILEQLAGLGEVDDRLAETARPFEHGRPDHRHLLDGLVVHAPRTAPGARQLDPAQVVAERADGRRDAHLVVVEHDQQARLAVADVVERLKAPCPTSARRRRPRPRCARSSRAGRGPWPGPRRSTGRSRRGRHRKRRARSRCDAGSRPRRPAGAACRTRSRRPVSSLCA